MLLDARDVKLPVETLFYERFILGLLFHAFLVESLPVVVDALFLHVGGGLDPMHIVTHLGDIQVANWFILSGLNHVGDTTYIAI